MLIATNKKRQEKSNITPTPQMKRLMYERQQNSNSNNININVTNQNFYNQNFYNQNFNNDDSQLYNEVQELREIILKQQEEINKLKEQPKTKNIRVINITPIEISPIHFYQPLNIEFLRHLNTNEVHIDVQTIREDSLIGILQRNSSFLETFQVLVFGCGDDGCLHYKTLSPFFFDLVVKFRDNGGAILMLHDFNCGFYKNSSGKLYDIFTKDLGFKGVHNNFQGITPFQRCKFNMNNCGNLNIYPYLINTEFSVVATHQTAIYNSKYTVIESSDVPGFHYYCENPKKKIADSNIGHDNRINDEEKKLFFNIIYHLSQL